MSLWLIIAAAASILLCLVAVGGEFVRTYGGHFDSFTIFLMVFFLQCLAPGAVVFSCLVLYGDQEISLGNTFFDHVYNVIEGSDAALVVGMGALFLLVAFLAYLAAMAGCSKRRVPPRRRLVVSAPALRVMVVLGLICGVVLILSLGDSVVSGYKRLVQFRNLDPGITRTALTANLFSLTQTFLLLGFLGLFLARRWRIVSASFAAWGAIVATFALLCVSRRSVLIPAILFVFTLLLAGHRPKLLQLVVFALAGVMVIMGGKQVFAYLSADIEQVNLPARDPLDNALYLASDIGITTTESLGTVALIDIPPRLGVDHVLSLLRRIPEGALGFDDPFPERIVRRSTAIFTHADDQDLPPGFVGMMWLDFRWSGPFIYGMCWGCSLACIERLRRRFVVDLQSSAVFAVGLFVFCLPLNTGSLDFTFSVDIAALTVMAFFVLRVRRVPGTRPTVEAVTP